VSYYINKKKNGVKRKTETRDDILSKKKEKETRDDI
jgi:hypothetical protein